MNVTRAERGPGAPCVTARVLGTTVTPVISRLERVMSALLDTGGISVTGTVPRIVHTRVTDTLVTVVVVNRGFGVATAHGIALEITAHTVIKLPVLVQNATLDISDNIVIGRVCQRIVENVPKIRVFVPRASSGSGAGTVTGSVMTRAAVVI